MNTRGPVRSDERIEFWDVLRGIAVLGILLANIPFMGLASGIVDHDLRPDSRLGDTIAFSFVFMVADTKFITIFSTLFGAGLGLMFERAVARGERFVPTYARRLVLLLVFGVVHATCIWYGDILFIYSLVGFAAILFRKCKPRTLVKWGILLFVINGLIWAGLSLLDPTELMELRKDAEGDELSFEEHRALELAEYREVFSSGDFATMAEKRVEVWLGTLAFLIIFFGSRSLAMFLFGMAAVKAGWFTAPGERVAMFRNIARLGLMIGFGIEAVAITVYLVNSLGGLNSPGHRCVGMTLLYFGGFAVAWGYISLVILWCLRRGADGLRARLAAVGRMALTNYLSHSVITGLIFNYAGVFDQWNRPVLLLVVLAIFVFQLWISPIWLRHFRFGPVEWLWRSLTYWKRFSFRRVPSESLQR